MFKYEKPDSWNSQVWENEEENCNTFSAEVEDRREGGALHVTPRKALQSPTLCQVPGRQAVCLCICQEWNLMLKIKGNTIYKLCCYPLKKKSLKDACKDFCLGCTSAVTALPCDCAWLGCKAKITNCINILRSESHSHKVTLRFLMYWMLCVWRKI